MSKDTNTFNLKDFITKLVIKFPSIQECYLFGSRAYKTGSLRSDIDILLHTNKPLPQTEVTRFCRYYTPIDLFVTTDCKTAISLTNGSAIDDNSGNLIHKLDAILIWDKNNKFTEDKSLHKHEILKDANFIPSILPITYSPSEDNTIPKTELGYNWEIASTRIIDIVKNSMLVAKKLKTHTIAKNINSNTLKIKSEYDFQNYTYIILKPWINSMDPEPFTVKIDGNEKNADFSISNNTLIIEEKYIDSVGKKSSVIKTIDGLYNFYKTQPNVKVVLFLILFESSVVIDEKQLEEKYTDISATPILRCSFIENDLDV